jgi:DNA polymerase
MGEAPGRDEDEQGKPFVGKCGKVLDSFLTSCRLDPEKDVFIMNVVGCRPPNNRPPKREEIDSCSTRTDYMIEVVNPNVILLLGSTAAKLADVLSIGPWRGQPVEIEKRGLIRTYRAVVTYHPSFYLRQGKSKDVERKILSDIKVARAIGRDK